MAATDNTTTIAAVSTPPGTGGIGIVRMSGPMSKPIAARLFKPAAPSFTDFKPRFMHYGQVADATGRPLDMCMAVYLPGPRTYTGEDMVEFQCHGGMTVMRLVLEALIEAGAEPAGPGEFTKRAFLSGRLDLSQAEAIAELINAPSRAGLDMARNKLSGGLSQKIRDLRADLETLRAGVCLAIDFPEEEVECMPPDQFLGGVRRALAGVREMLAGYNRARPWREGLLAVLAGQVNAGKSSLMNALLGRERAIVTDLPGTTRDYLEESIDLDGLPVRLVDTAGLRDTGDAIELEGVKRSRELIDSADVVLLVIDASRPAEDIDMRMAKELGAHKTLVVCNKADLAPADPDPCQSFIAQGLTAIRISSSRHLGLDELAEAIRDRAPGDFAEPGAEAAAPNLRQAKGLEAAQAELEELELDAQAEVPYDLLSVRLETACAHLSEITGDIAPDDVLNSVFESFCIGK
jgi:tRNA modification GTPase